MSREISDKAIMAIQLKNIILIIATCLSVYYVSGWMIFMMMFYTTVNDKEEQV